ncbi:MAG: DsrE family protein [Bacteroidales bacterium]|jgi:predicted peroxiredoxin|nr:DsrE family protein [Bacteroidales bacterium]
MKRIALIALLAFIVSACNQQPKETVVKEIEKEIVMGEPATDGVFIHISSGYDDPHRALMPLKMATLMAEDKDVLVYMDIEAVKLLVKDARDLSHANFESAHTYIRMLLEKNVGVYACPTCLEAAGYQPEDLMEGIQLAQKDKFFSFTKGRILTLDY